MRRVAPVLHLFSRIAVLFVATFFVGKRVVASPVIDIRQFFLEPDQKAVLHLPCDKSSGATTRYVVTDYLGEMISTGNAEVRDGLWEIPVNLPAGYYDLSLPDLGQFFGLASIHRYEGIPDPFFCMDAGLSWLAPEPMWEPYVQLLKRSGIAMVRERLSWPSLHASAEAAWTWNADHGWDRMRKLYLESGIPILELAHGAPGRFTPRANMVWPDRMVEAIDEWKTISKRWSPVWGAIESWNEPDVDDIPPDQYVSWVKALHYAVRFVGADTPLGGGVFAFLDRPYMDMAAKNGLLNHSNFISFHFYGQPAGLEAEVAEFRRWTKEFKRPEMPLWITEAGALWEGTPDTRAPVPLIQTSAVRITGNTVEAKACGIARYFPFFYINYSENGKNNYGLLDHNGTPTRSMVSYAATTRILRNGDYIGDLPVSDPVVKRARVFTSGDQEAVVVLYTGNVDSGRTVPFPFPVRQVLGIDGRALRIEKAQTVPIPDGIGFVVVSRDAIKTSLNIDTDTVALSKQGKGSSVPSPTPSPIILKLVLTDPSITNTKHGYSLAEGIKKLPLSMLVTNCEPKGREVQLTFSDATSGGAILATVSGTVPAAGDASLNAELDLTGLHPNAAGVYQVRAEAQSPGVDRIEPVIIELLPARGLDEYLKQFSYRFVIPLGEEHRWSTNVAEMGSMSFQHGPEAQWGFTVKFSGGDRWVYPKYVLPQEIKLDKAQGILIRARCLQPAGVKALAWSKDDAMAMTPSSIIPADGAWHVSFIPFDGLLREKGGIWGSNTAVGLTKISIGLNSQSDQNQLEVSDLYFVGK